MHHPPVFSLHTLTQITAAVACAPFPLQFGWRLTPTQLRELAARIGPSQPRLRQLAQSPHLAAHVTWLLAADLLACRGAQLVVGAQLSAWLALTPADQVDFLAQAVRHEPAWRDALAALHLQSQLDLPAVAYMLQRLTHQLEIATAAPPGPAVRLLPQAEAWEVIIQPTCPARLLFDLLHITEARSTSWLRLTPLSLARAWEHGIDRPRLLEWLTQGAGRALTVEETEQLETWWARTQAYHLRPAHLLTTRQAEQLTAVLHHRYLKLHVVRQLGPRQAEVTAHMAIPLRRWLASQGLPLLMTPTVVEAPSPPAGEPTAWLALQVVQHLQPYLHTPIPGLARALAHQAAGLSATQQAALTHQARGIATEVAQLIRGRDAFRPAEKAPAPDLLTALRAALEEGGTLVILYQGPGDAAPRRRSVEPLRLETHGRLVYLHAYCHLAEAERLFRLDRVTDWEKPTT